MNATTTPPLHEMSSVPRRFATPWLALSSLTLALLAASEAAAQTIDAGVTGFDVKRPVLASACPHGCPWGELGDFVTEAMKPHGYEVVLCRNCNRDLGPRVVSKADYPPELTAVDEAVGTTTRVNAPVDFGVTESGFLSWAYEGLYHYADEGPYSNLRLIAKIEDPTYLLVAVKEDSGITDLAQIAEAQMPVRIIGGDSPITTPVLEHYGLTREAVESWGGSMQSAILASALRITEFDVIVGDLASPANNPESSIWSLLSQTYELRFLDLPEDLLDELASKPELGLHRVTAKWGLLHGVDRAIPTVARSGEAIFARDDTPDDAAYDVAKAIDEHRAALKWFIRPYSYDSNTVWKNFDVPLHPGAERYYREAGYLPGGSETDAGSPAAGDAGASAAGDCSDDGCALHGGRAPSGSGAAWLIAASALAAAAWRSRGSSPRTPTA